MGSFHTDTLRKLSDLAFTQQQLLLQIGAFELLSRFTQRQAEKIAFDEWFGFRCFGQDRLLDLTQCDLFITRRRDRRD